MDIFFTLANEGIMTSTETNLRDVFTNLKNGSINYHNFYNSDIDIPEYYAIEHYAKHPEDSLDVDQLLNILFFDIECYANNEKFDLDSYKHDISAITIYSTFDKVYYAYLNILDHVKDKIIPEQDAAIQIRKQLIDDGYIMEDETVECFYFTNELKLLESCWQKIHDLKVSVLSGFFADKFDLPYIVNRLMILLNGDEKKVNRILSKFGIVKERGFDKSRKLYQILEYPLMDIRHLYIPRDEGGLNYGKKRASYSLDFISEIELNLKKINYTQTGQSLDSFYDNDPIGYLLYNVVDVVLTVRLNEKLRHIELHNILRRDMKTPLSMSLRGSSALFDCFFYYELAQQNNKFRYGVIDEHTRSIDKLEVLKIQKPKNKVIKVWDLEEVDEKLYRKIISKFPGAYVKESPNVIVDHNDGLHVDLDATALYPSMMLQNNISFDTYYGKIIDPFVYKILGLLDKNLGSPTPLPLGIHNTIFDLIVKYVNRMSPQNKKKYMQAMYFMIMNLLETIKSNNIKLYNVMNPIDYTQHIILKLFLIPFLDLFTEIHPDFAEVNSFVHDYLINDEFKVDNIYILEHDFSPNMRIISIPSNTFDEYLKRNEICVNISGSLFYTHEHKQGILNKFIDNRLAMRKSYKTSRDGFDETSDEYAFYDRRQAAVKINANTSYGLTGMSTFRFSNKQLAKSTTLSGKLCLKIAQQCGELYLNEYSNKKGD